MASERAQFKLRSDFTPKGDQPAAIEALMRRARRRASAPDAARHHRQRQDVHDRQRHPAATERPTLIIAPNKTLAAQLYGEMRDLFPENAVAYFVSYYDYYQPEAYIPTTDTFIEKDAIINDQIDRMRHAATHALLSRRT